MQDNTVVVVGNLGADPEHRRLDNGAEVTNFRVGSTPRRFDRTTSTWSDGPTSWWRISCWRGLAANTAHSLRKGDRVVVVGRVRTSSWETEERSGTSVEVDADAVGHDLAWGTSTFQRVVRSERVELTGGEGRSEAGGDAEADPWAEDDGVAGEAVEDDAQEPARV